MGDLAETECTQSLRCLVKMFWSCWWMLACLLVGGANAQSEAPCDAPLRTPSPDAKCEGLYPTILSSAGGERVLMAFSNLDIPWYVKAQYDPCPWNKGAWLSSMGKPQGWEHWLQPPRIRIVSADGHTLIDQEKCDLKVLNRTLDPVEFREIMHVTPDRNAELLKLHKDHTLITFKMPPSPSGQSGKFDTYLLWDNNEK